jgi:tetratricopeptide (TPR) repeat protein
MRFAWLLILIWQAGAADLLDQTRERGTLLEADRQWEQAGALCRVALGNLCADASLQDRFWLLTSLVEVSFEQQDYGQARRWLQEAEKAVGDLNPSVPERVRLLSAWGTLHLVEGNLTVAELDLSRAVAASESIAKPPDLAAALHNLAAVEMHTGRLEAAAVHEKKALALWRQEFGDRNHYVMKAWISLSSLEGLRGDWLAAERSLQKALAITETPEALANYAVVLEKLKRHREAKEIRRRLHLPMPSPSALADVKGMPYETGRLRIRTQ